MKCYYDLIILSSPACIRCVVSRVDINSLIKKPDPFKNNMVRPNLGEPGSSLSSLQKLSLPSFSFLCLTFPFPYISSFQPFPNFPFSAFPLHYLSSSLTFPLPTFPLSHLSFSNLIPSFSFLYPTFPLPTLPLLFFPLSNLSLPFLFLPFSFATFPLLYLSPFLFPTFPLSSFQPFHTFPFPPFPSRTFPLPNLFPSQPFLFPAFFNPFPFPSFNISSTSNFLFLRPPFSFLSSWVFYFSTLEGGGALKYIHPCSIFKFPS